VVLRLRLQQILLAGLVVVTMLIVATAPRLGFARPAHGLGLALETGVFVLAGITAVTLVGRLMRDAGDRASEKARAQSARRERALAREFHGSLAQDLAFIVTYTSTAIVRGEGPEMLDEVLAAATRSLDEVRRAMAILSGEGSVTAPSVDRHRSLRETVDQLTAAHIDRIPVLHASASYVREHL